MDTAGTASGTAYPGGAVGGNGAVDGFVTRMGTGSARLLHCPKTVLRASFTETVLEGATTPSFP